MALSPCEIELRKKCLMEIQEYLWAFVTLALICFRYPLGPSTYQTRTPLRVHFVAYPETEAEF